MCQVRHLAGLLANHTNPEVACVLREPTDYADEIAEHVIVGKAVTPAVPSA